MTAVVLAPSRRVETLALVSALEAGLGPVLLHHDLEGAAGALRDHPRAVLVLDLRGADASAAPGAARLRADHPTCRMAALVDRDAAHPVACDAVFPAPVFLETVVRWCARALGAPLSRGALQDLAAGLSHEIGNPLTSLLLQLEMLKADDEMGERLAPIEASARRIQTVIADVASAAEFDPVRLGPTSLQALLAGARAGLEERAPGLAQRATETCVDAPLQADQDLLARALSDLWEYLLAAGEETAPLQVEARPAGPSLAVVAHEVLASRLPDDAAARLFTPLWARQALGLAPGLSLTSARNAFLRHKGDLRARARPGGILRVEAILPLDPGGPPPATAR